MIRKTGTILALLTLSVALPVAPAMTTPSDPPPDPTALVGAPGDIAAAPPGLGALDPWIDAAGDQVFGVLRFTNGDLDAVTPGQGIRFNGARLCIANVETAGCAGSGDISSVTAGFGLSGGAASGDAALSVDPTAIQRRVIGSCAAGSSIRLIDSGGGVQCQTDNGGAVTGTAPIAVSGADVALSTTGCPAGAGWILVSGAWKCTRLWNVGGNSGTVAGTDFLGTTDQRALDVRVNNVRALRIEPGTTPNIVAGLSSNSAGAGAVGATVAGGGDSVKPNAVTDSFGTVGGGARNQAGNLGGPSDRQFATVAGGLSNTASGTFSFVGGGESNMASGVSGTVAGGSGNGATANFAAVGGGNVNTANGAWSVVAGGRGNQASGESAVVPGGGFNLASGAYSFAAGRHALATNQGAFVWADSRDFEIASATADEMLVRATGGFRFVTAIDAGTGLPTAGAVLAPGSGSWTSLSDRAAKTAVTPVDPLEVLSRLRQVPVSEWSYGAQSPEVRHMGPMAQDFHAAFGLGEDPRGISSVDADGVALSAIQGLHQLVLEQQALLESQSRAIERLEARLLALEAGGLP